MTQLLPSAQCNRQNFAVSKLSSAAGEPSAPIRSAYQQLPSFLLEPSRRERDPNKERRSKKSTRLWERQSKVRQMQETESVKSQQGSNPLPPPPEFPRKLPALIAGYAEGSGQFQRWVTFPIKTNKGRIPLLLPSPQWGSPSSLPQHRAFSIWSPGRGEKQICSPQHHRSSCPGYQLPQSQVG